jgi:transcriptional regulator with XRE-family HTH domain
MARTLDQVLATLPAKRRAKIERRTSELATLKDLRQAVERTQEELATSLGVGQDTISRIERRSDMLLSTLRRYVEAMGGKLELVAEFPDRPRMVIDQLTTTREKSSSRTQAKSKHGAKSRHASKRHAATA